MSNPYIDNNLLKCQSQFSARENKLFEHKHKVSLKSNDTFCTESKVENNVLFIKFKWNDRVLNKSDCDTKHLLYLIYLSLIAVEERQKFKNKYYLQLNRSERVLKLLDKEEIMTNLISWHQEDIVNNKLNGDLFTRLGPKHFINNILTKYGGKQCSMGWSTKIYSKLNQIDISNMNINGNVFISNYKFTSIQTKQLN